jgi:hypothetical protein
VRLRAAAIAIGCVAAAVLMRPAPPPALADGDPCSDFLLTYPLCPPESPRPSQPQIDRLKKTIDYAKAHGFEVRVAVIASKQDLGSNPEFFGIPQPYAKFLDAEIQFAYKGRLLVVMAKGYGTRQHARPDPADARALHRMGLPSDGRPDTLMTAANEAVRRMAGAAGVKVPEFTVATTPPPATSTDGGGGGTSTRTVLLLIAGGLVVLAAVIGGILFWPARGEDDQAPGNP